jgi:hypothetical protein
MYTALTTTQQFVLVGNVEVVDDSKGVVEHGTSPVCVSIGLKAFYDSLCGPGDSLYYSAFFSRYKFLLPHTDRELNFEIRMGVPLEDERPNQMIQTGSEMLDNLSSQDRKPQGDGLGLGDKDAFLRLMIDVSSYDVGIRVKKGGNFGFEILDILVGPLNLRPATVEWI